MKKLLVCLVVAALSGCAAYKPVPENYTGPLATVSDTGKSEDSSKAKIFALTQVDGHSIAQSFEASRLASYNQGPTLTLRLTNRELPARPMKVKLRASHITGMPIHEFASRAMGTFFEVEGIVDFQPAPNGKYIVNGELAKNASSVWIEDAETHEPVTEKVSSK